jgi:integrative and conjugative element protein (TIGR02256 family)
MLAFTGLDLMTTLRRHFREWTGNIGVLSARLILIVSLPKRRADDAEAEAEETWGFLTTLEVRQVGVEIGLWELRDGIPGLLVVPPQDRNGSAVKLELLNPVETLTRSAAAILNGLAAPAETRVVAVGAGALGSQIIINLVRAGYCTWTVVDDDWFLPHNLTRHYLGHYAIGSAKADVLSWVANGLLDGPRVATPIIANIRSSSKNEQLRESLQGAGVIADFSASVTAARHLALDIDSDARRISVFLNPDGTDLIVLAEDAERRTTLDQLEMQYYREVITRPELEQHLTRRGQRLRYARSCRDVTATMPQDAVATLAGVGARAVRTAMDRAEPTLAIWRTDEELNVSSIRSKPAPTVRLETEGWVFCTDTHLLGKLRELRAAKLPNETGGVLIGSYDLQRRIVYVVDTIPSPADSKEWPTLYIRGSEGLRQRIQEIDDRSAGWLQYVGEWHSHPDRHSCAPSSDDRKVFDWITTHLGVDGLPGLMIIVGQDDQLGVFLGQI